MNGERSANSDSGTLRTEGRALGRLRLPRPCTLQAELEPRGPCQAWRFHPLLAVTTQIFRSPPAFILIARKLTIDARKIMRPNYVN